MRVYVDTNVYISSIRQEIGFNYRLLGDMSDTFFAACAKKGIIIVISDVVLFEIIKIVKLDESDVFGFFEERNLHFEYTITKKTTKQEGERMMREAGIHYMDAIHVANAKNNKCDLLITWNMNDFDKTQRIIRAMTPESFPEIL